MLYVYATDCVVIPSAYIKQNTWKTTRTIPTKHNKQLKINTNTHKDVTQTTINSSAGSMTDDQDVRVRKYGEVVFNTLTSVASVLEYPKGLPNPHSINFRHYTSLKTGFNLKFLLLLFGFSLYKTRSNQRFGTTIILGARSRSNYLFDMLKSIWYGGATYVRHSNNAVSCRISHKNITERQHFGWALVTSENASIFKIIFAGSWSKTASLSRLRSGRLRWMLTGTTSCSRTRLDHRRSSLWFV